MFNPCQIMRTTGSPNPWPARTRFLTRRSPWRQGPFPTLPDRVSYPGAANQKARSPTTHTATMATTRIGYMIGPPLRKLSMTKFASIGLDDCGSDWTFGSTAGEPQ